MSAIHACVSVLPVRPEGPQAVKNKNVVDNEINIILVNDFSTLIV